MKKGTVKLSYEIGAQQMETVGAIHRRHADTSSHGEDARSVRVQSLKMDDLSQLVKKLDAYYRAPVASLTPGSAKIRPS